MTHSRPRRDALPLVAGAVIIWIAVSPWLWGFSNSGPAVANHVSMFLGIGPLALMLAALRPAAFVTFLAGFWLGLSPWILGYAGKNLAWVNELATGILLVALAASAAGARAPARVRRRNVNAGATTTLPAREPPAVGH